MKLPRFFVLIVFLCSALNTAAQEQLPPGEDTLLISDSSLIRSELEDIVEPANSKAGSDTAEEEAYSLRQVPDSIATKIRKSKEFAYANDPEYWKKKEQEDNTGRTRISDFLSSSAFRSFFYLLIASLLVFASYRIITGNNPFRSSGKKSKTVEDPGSQEETELVNLDEKIKLSITKGEYRNATRFLYLKSLQQLNEKKYIHYNIQSTNYDYLQQVKGSAIENDFRFLMKAYEYAWYGNFEPGVEKFQTIQNRFNQLFTSIR